MSNSSHYPHYYSQPQAPPYPSQAYPHQSSTTAASRPHPHSARSQAPSYPSVSYAQQQYHPPAPTAGASGSNQAWYGGTGAGSLNTAQPTSAQTVTYGEAAPYGASGNQDTNRSFGDARGLGSLAYASSLTPSTRDHPAGSMEPIQASLSTTVTVAPERYQHRPSVANSASRARRPFTTPRSSAPVNTTPVTSTPYLQSVVHDYTPQSTQQTTSTSSTDSARLGSIAHLPDASAAPEPSVAYSYQSYSAPREASVQASTYPQHPQQPRPPTRNIQSPAPSAVRHARTPSIPTRQTPTPHSVNSQAAGGQSVSHTQAYSHGTAHTTEQRVASPFNIGQFHPPRRASPLATSGSHISPPLSAAASSAPTTVDPSMVYNPYRESYCSKPQQHTAESLGTANSRAAEMDTSAVTGGGSTHGTSRAVNGFATEAGTAQQDDVSESTTLAQASSMSTAAVVPSENINPATETSVPEDDDVETELKEMVERMREIQSRNPSRFAKAWEDVKKVQSGSSGQAPGGRAARASPQTQAMGVVLNSSSRSEAGEAEHMSPAPAQQARADVHHGRSANLGPEHSTPQAVPHADTPEIQTINRGSTVEVGTDLVNQRAPTTTGPAAASGTQAPLSTSAPADKAPPGHVAAHPTKAPPSATPKGNTYWPESNKATLAMTAANTLMSYPQNAGKVIPSSKILEMLDQNPSYMQLCEALEGWGFWLDRTSFAKVLLAAVQESQAPTNQQPQAAVETTSARVDTSARQPPPAVAESAPVESAQEAADAQEVTASAPKKRGRKRKQKSDIFTGLGKTGAELPPAATPIPSKAGVNPPEANTPSQPMSCARKARKSAPSLSTPAEVLASYPDLNPGEIEALLSLQSAADRNEPIWRSQRSRKTVQTTLPVHKASESVHDTAPQEQIRSTSTVKASEPTAASASKRGTPHQRELKTPASSERVQPSPASRPLTKAEASRKRNFSEIVDLTLDPHEDPRYSGGGTSTPGPSKTHSVRAETGLPSDIADEPSRKRPKTVTTPSMLPTQDTSAGRREWFHRTANLAQPIDKKQARKGSEYDVRTIARDILLATGRHPNLRNLNDHLKVFKQRFLSVGETTDMSTFRWDLVDPVPEEEPTADSPTAWADDMIDKVAESSDSVQELAALPHRPVSTTTSPATIRQSGVATPSPAKRTPGRRRSHQVRYLCPPLPGNCLEHASETVSRLNDVDDDGDTVMRSPQESEVEEVARFGPTDNPSLATQPLDQYFHRSPATPLPQASVASRSPTPRFHSPLARSPSNPFRTPRRPGRVEDIENVAPTETIPPSTPPQFKSPSVPIFSQHMTTKEVAPESSPREPAKDLPLPIFKCLWPDCRAELHNLAILRRHVRKLHVEKNAEGHYPCLWPTCKGFIDRSLPKKQQKPEPRLYSTEEIWFGHINRRHIGAYGWEYGDGPQTLRKDQRWKASDLLAQSILGYVEAEWDSSSLAGRSDDEHRQATGVHAALTSPEKNLDEGALVAVLGDGGMYMDEDLLSDFERGFHGLRK